MHRALSLFRSSVGKKIWMALTGAMLFGFVLVHMAGNLKLFQGPEKFNAYAAFLREVGSPVFGPGQLLWIARAILLVAVLTHIYAAARLTRLSRHARPTGYHKVDNLSFSYASRTMRWGGVIVLAFIVYHLLHLTLGTVHHDFSHESVYSNVISGFKLWYVSLAYVVAMVPLGLHIYHGLWSATQTLGVRNPGLVRLRRPLAAGIALLIVLGNVSMPISVLAGLIH